MKKIFLTSLGIVLLSVFPLLKAEDVTIKISKRYLNLPVSHDVRRATMQFKIENKTERSFDIRLAPAKADYWVFCDVQQYIGKNITISYEGDQGGMNKIYQENEIQGQDEIYKEENRPQLHFTTKRGWINDPNGLVYYEGEYHLFYQLNPYEHLWGNMHWGHAVSTDLIHWEELSPALYPDKNGTMYSGSAVVDYKNTAGFNQGDTPAIIAYFTASNPDRQVQCFAYSLDKGRSWTKYTGNPVIDSKAKWNSHDTRDPKVFWYNPGNHWVMALNERDGHSIYTSPNLKEWTYQSHVTGFWECPDLFELPVDGDTGTKKWVMYGASGTYMIGSFDGKTFTPESGKYYYTTGSIYAAQTYSNIPASDGRRIQVGWGRISHPGMAFNGQMLIPTELTLRTTKDGIRLFSNPVREFDVLQAKAGEWGPISIEKANELMQPFNSSDGLRIKMTFKLSHATGAGLSLNGQNLLAYDLNNNLINGVFYSPENMTSMELKADLILDRTSVEAFIDNGAYSFSMERKEVDGNNEGFKFWGKRDLEIENLEIYTLRSIWK